MPQLTRSGTANGVSSSEVLIAAKHPKIVHPRMMWILSYMENKNLHLVCRKFCISRKTFYKWLKRYRNSGGNPASLLDNPRRPHHFPKATPESVVRRILQAKKETGFGQRRLKNYLAQKYRISVSEHTIWKLVKRFRPENGSGVYAPSLPAGARPGDLVQISAKDVTIYTNQKPYAQSCVEYTVLDPVTMLRISKIYPKHSWRNAADFVKFTIEKFPLSIKEAETPNDGLFTYHRRGSISSFEKLDPVPVLLQKANIRQTLSSASRMHRFPTPSFLEFDDEDATTQRGNGNEEDPSYSDVKEGQKIGQGRPSSQSSLVAREAERGVAFSNRTGT